jgi:hypothetical protein
VNIGYADCTNIHYVVCILIHVSTHNKEALMPKYLFLFIFIFLCCSPIKNYDYTFINTYDNENFSDFKNTGFAIRSGDFEGNVIIVISHDLINAATKGPYFVTVNQRNNKIISTSLKLVRDTTGLDTIKLNELALRFFKYKIQSLKVDSKENVYIGIESNERQNLIRINDSTSISNTNKKWKKIRNNWFKTNEY